MPQSPELRKLWWAVASLYLPIPTFVLGWLISLLVDPAEGAAELIPLIPFMLACMAAFFGVQSLISHAKSNPALGAEERKSWARQLYLGWPVTGPRYLSLCRRERDE